MRQREFLGVLISSAVPWPLAARGQHAGPVIGALLAATAERLRRSENVTIVCRFADDQLSKDA